MSEETDRDAILREIAKKKVIYQLPAMDAVVVRRDLTYPSTSGAELPMDVYYPPPQSPIRRPPTILLPMAYPDPTARVRAYGPVTSWARLIAASGMAAIVYGAAAPEDDVHAVMRYLRTGADALAVDGDNFGIFATSGNVTVGLSAVMHDRQVKCAALLYGYTMDADGSTAVADMSRQAGFVDACAGHSVDDLPDNVPILFVRAGREHFPGLNDALDKVVGRALARNCRFLSSTTRPGSMVSISTKTRRSRGGSFIRYWRFCSSTSGHCPQGTEEPRSSDRRPRRESWTTCRNFRSEGRCWESTSRRRGTRSSRHQHAIREFVAWFVLGATLAFGSRRFQTSGGDVPL